MTSKLWEIVGFCSGWIKACLPHVSAFLQVPVDDRGDICVRQYVFHPSALEPIYMMNIFFNTKTNLGHTVET